MSFNAQIMTSHGGRPVACQHRTIGACTTRSGYARKACLHEAEAHIATGERVLSDADDMWVFPDARSMADAGRAAYARRTR